MPLHIVQRGHNARRVFSQPADYGYYLANLRSIKDELSIQVFGYCLMTNHVHLVIAPGEHTDNVSRFMRVLAARQTRYVNKVEHRTGTLWESRFKSSLIDTDSYLLTCLRYVDLNPVRAGLVAVPDDYRWSSYRWHAGAAGFGWLDECETYRGLGQTREERASAYRQLIMDGIEDEELAFIRTALRRNQVTGKDRFRERIAARIGRQISALSPGRPADRR